MIEARKVYLFCLKSQNSVLPSGAAKAFQFPPINPYLAKNASFENGVVFSVAGCTAQNLSLLITKAIFPFLLNVPLVAQLAWFKSYLASTCESPEGL